MAERLTQDFRAERRAAHAAEHEVFELAHAANAIGKRNQIIFDADHLVRHGEPTERILDDFLMRRVFPKGCVLAPDTANDIAFVSFLDRRADRIVIFSKRSS